MNAIDVWLQKMLTDKKTAFWMYVGLAYAILLSISILLSFFPTTLFGVNWNWGLEMFLALVVYTLASFKMVSETEQGMRLLIGEPFDNVPSGLIFVPLWIFRLITETRLNIQDELPCDPEHIYREPKEGSDGVIPEGMFPPIRMPFGPPEKGDGIPEDDPYNIRMVVEVVPVVTWKIDDLITFRTTIGSVKEARRQMEDEAVAMMTEAFAKITPAVALRKLPKYSEELKVAIETKVEDWGITIISAKIKPFNFSRSLNKAILGVPEATVAAKAAIITATGNKQVLQLNGEGAGAAEKALLEGRTAGLKKMAVDLNVSGASVLGAETARGVTSNPGQRTIIAGSHGFADLATIGTVLGDSLKN